MHRFHIVLVGQEHFHFVVFLLLILFVERYLNDGIAVPLEHCYYPSGNFGPPFTLTTA